MACCERSAWPAYTCRSVALPPLQALLHPNSTEVREARGGNPPGTSAADVGTQDQPTAAAQPFTAGDVALLLLDSPIEGAQPVEVATTEQWDCECGGTLCGLQGGCRTESGWRAPGCKACLIQHAALAISWPPACLPRGRQSSWPGSSLQLNDNVATLPPPRPPPPRPRPLLSAIDAPGTELRVVGWGAISEGDSPASFPRQLQEGTLPLVDPAR